ncbi:hypothetical protein B7435_00970 [Mycolicibacterium peregrinum]|uniref:HNH endonuclease signature motif containing protein n=1 Tax=Mycolicibacterium peregrinum TaxID=43304 RepID=UPI000B4B38C5|nr:HNH endonuclease signature motif containing protein [Mycolicibacterium peregrinum]OWM12245.1 hypothetical protein B7435_00970 [Mycolicibacterium peregrinum]
MTVGLVQNRGAVQTALADHMAATTALLHVDFTGFDTAELLAIQSERERRARAQATVDHRIQSALMARTSPREIGGKSWTDVLATRMRISRKEASRRVAAAADLGPRYGLTGEVLEPTLPACAEALRSGSINTEHITIIRHTLAEAEKYVGPAELAQIESDLVSAATRDTPETLKAAADKLLYLLNQDGAGPDVAAHLRGLRIGKQDADGLVHVEGWLDPEAAAYLTTVTGVWGAPGINNPTDPEPLHNPSPNPLEAPADPPQTDLAAPQAQQAAADRDTRTQAQRNHDALKVALRELLMSKRLGRHAGLPVTVVVSTTLAELEAGAGIAVTGAGIRMPMKDLIRLASHSFHYLTVYEHHTAEPLYMARTKRLATKAQRLLLYNRDRGCTRPGCTAPADYCEAHHAEADWQHGGRTDAPALALSCGPDNRLAGLGWTTSVDPETGRIHWHPPPLMDTGQDSLNHHFHPEELLVPPEP